MSNPIILVLNGPNLNMLGLREPGIYGSETLADIEARLQGLCDIAAIRLDFRQSNSEAELVTWVQGACNNTHVLGVIINAGAYTHTSVAIHDALRLLSCPIIEVHISNPMAREAFRHVSYIAPLAKASICGLGAEGYAVALRALLPKA